MSRTRLISLFASLMACLSPLGVARAAMASYHYDTVHSQILFSISHDGYSRPFGRLHISKGWLRLDPADLGSASTEVDIDLAGVDMGDAQWNAAVCKPALLDCAKDRYAHFVSTSIERKDSEHGVLHGELTLRGMKQKLDIPFTLNRVASTIYGMHEIAGFSAAVMLDRKAFGITAYGGSIGQQVSVWLELEGIRDDSDSSKQHP